MTNKFTRSQKRKEKREALKNFGKNEKHELNPNGKPFKKIRKLKDGGIGFGKNFKIGRTGGFTMIGISVFVCVFYMGITGMFDSILPPVDEYDYDFSEYDYEFSPYFTVTDDGKEYYVVKDSDGEFMTDSSGNMIKFTSKETVNEFKKRLDSANSKQSFLNNISNFFL